MKRNIHIGLLFAVLACGAASAGAPEGRIYAAWNPNDANPAILISDDDLTVSRTVEGTEWAAIRATIGVEEGSWYWEVTYNHVGGDAVAGFGDDDALLSNPPGGADAQSEGLNTSGEWLFVGWPWAHLGAVPDGGIVRFWFDADSQSVKVANGSDRWWALPVHSGRPLAGLLRPAGTDVSLTANFGQHAFAYDVPPGAHPGLYVEDRTFRNGFESAP